MPRASDPRIVIRLSPADAAVIEAAAASVGVAVGGLVRECAVRYAAVVARDVSAGHVKLRRRSSTAPVPVPGGGGRVSSSSEPARSELVDPGVARAMAFRRALTPR